MSRAIPWAPPPAPRRKRHIYRMTEGPDTVIAESEEHAWEVCEEYCGESSDDHPDERWVQVDPDERMEVGFESDDDLRETLREAERSGADLQDAVVSIRVRGLDYLAHRVSRPDRCRYAITAPARWWATMPAGLLCSEEW